LVHRWSRTTGADMSAPAVARRLATTAPEVAALPAGLRTLAFDVQGFDLNTAVTAWVRGADAREFAISLSARGHRLAGRLPRGDGPLRLVAVGVDQSADYATHHAHNIGEGNTDQPLLSGTLVLGRPAGVGSGWTWTSWGSLRGTAVPSDQRLRLSYRINAAPVIAAANYASARAATLPVVVDPATAADIRGGLLELQFDSSTTVEARVVATAPRLPTVSGSFVLVDRTALTTAFDVREPGRNATEFWIAAPAGSLDQTLRAAPFIDLTVTRRDAVQADLDADPIGRGARTLLVAVALLALAVAALALVLLVVGERRDGAGELYAWEADGMRPATLRGVLAIRLLAVAGVGIPIGVVAGLVVARAGATLVVVDASGSTPTPPLAVTLGSLWTPLALVIGVGAGLVLGVLVALRSLRERFPLAAEVELR
ncbi:MAG: hypothetical protein ACRDVG_05755, partial [Jatrophihabitantaceae bacterium]